MPKLNCVAILNEDCDIDPDAFYETKFSSNYTSLINSSSYCIDNTVYDKCDNNEFKYIYNLNTPDICINNDYVYAYYINDNN